MMNNTVPGGFDTVTPYEYHGDVEWQPKNEAVAWASEQVRKQFEENLVK